MRAKTSPKKSGKAQALDDLLSWLIVVVVLLYRRRAKAKHRVGRM